MRLKKPRESSLSHKQDDDAAVAIEITERKKIKKVYIAIKADHNQMDKMNKGKKKYTYMYVRKYMPGRGE